MTITSETPAMMNVILSIPANAVMLNIDAVTFDDELNKRVFKAKLPFSAITAARKDFLDSVPGGDDYNVEYSLTEKGETMLRDMESEAAR